MAGLAAPGRWFPDPVGWPNISWRHQNMGIPMGFWLFLVGGDWNHGILWLLWLSIHWEYIIIPSDELHHFSEGRYTRKTTNQRFWLSLMRFEVDKSKLVRIPSWCINIPFLGENMHWESVGSIPTVRIAKLVNRARFAQVYGDRIIVVSWGVV